MVAEMLSTKRPMQILLLLVLLSAIAYFLIRWQKKFRFLNPQEDAFTSLAFDHVDGLLYGLTAGGCVLVCNRKSARSVDSRRGVWTCIKVFNSTGASNEETIYFSIALNPAKGEMYVGTIGGGLLRLEMDGSNVMTFINGTETRFTGLVVDDNSSQLYWTDEGNDRIQRTRLDGSGGVETLVQLNELGSPREMIKVNDTLYWNSLQNYLLQAVTVKGEDLRVAHNGSHGIFGLVVVASKEYYERGHVRSRCEGHGCSHMCVPTARSFRCLCTERMHILEDGKTCANGPF